MLRLIYYGLFTDVEVISPSSHISVAGVFAVCIAVCIYSNNISLMLGFRINLNTVS